MIVSNQLIARKAADQTVASSTAVADTELVLPIAAGAIVAVRMFVVFNLPGAISGYQFFMNGPNVPTSMLYIMEIKNIVSSLLVKTVSGNAFGGAIAGALATIGTHQFTLEGIIENGVNAGNIELRFGQNGTDAGNPLAVKRGSYIQLTPLN